MAKASTEIMKMPLPPRGDAGGDPDGHQNMNAPAVQGGDDHNTPPFNSASTNISKSSEDAYSNGEPAGLRGAPPPPPPPASNDEPYIPLAPRPPLDLLFQAILCALSMSLYLRGCFKDITPWFERLVENADLDPELARGELTYDALTQLYYDGAPVGAVSAGGKMSMP
jgi:hypothetical protein